MSSYILPVVREKQCPHCLVEAPNNVCLLLQVTPGSTICEKLIETNLNWFPADAPLITV